MVGDAVEQSVGEPLAGEHRGPLLEGQVGSHDCAAVPVAPAEDVEQELASGLRVITSPDGAPTVLTY